MYTFCSFAHSRFYYCFRLWMSCIQAKQQSPRQRSGRSLQKCTKPPQMWCSSSASKLSLAVARQQGLAWSMTRWTTPRKMSPNTGCKGYATHDACRIVWLIELKWKGCDFNIHWMLQSESVVLIRNESLMFTNEVNMDVDVTVFLQL